MPAPRFKNGLCRMPNGVYHMKFKLKGQEVHESTGCLTRDAAILVLKRRRDGIAKELAGIPAIGKAPTLKQIVPEWKKHALARGRSASQIRNVTKSVPNHLGTIAHLPISILTTKRVEDVLTLYLQQPGNTTGGANHLLRNLNNLVNFAVRRKWGITEKPYDVPQERVQELPKVYVPLDRVAEFFNRMCELAPQHAVDLCLIMYGCGFRETDARHARVERVDLAMASIMSWDPVQGTKSKKVHSVPIPSSLLPHIKRMIGDRTEGYLVPGRAGNPHKRAYTLPYVKATAAALGIPGLTPHNLRGTFATLLSSMGAPDVAIQNGLGHSDPKTTRIYTMPRQEDLIKAMEKLEGETGLGGVTLVATHKWKRKRRKAMNEVA